MLAGQFFSSSEHFFLVTKYSKYLPICIIWCKHGVEGLNILYFNELKKLESWKLKIVLLSRIPIIPIHKYKSTIKIHYNTIHISYYTDYDFENIF